MLKITQTLSFSTLAFCAFALPTALASQVNGLGAEVNNGTLLQTGTECTWAVNAPAGYTAMTGRSTCAFGNFTCPIPAAVLAMQVANAEGIPANLVPGNSEACTGMPLVIDGNTNPVQNTNNTDVVLDVDANGDAGSGNDPSDDSQNQKPDLVVVKQPSSSIHQDSNVLSLSPKRR